MHFVISRLHGVALIKNEISIHAAIPHSPIALRRREIAAQGTTLTNFKKGPKAYVSSISLQLLPELSITRPSPCSLPKHWRAVDLAQNLA